MAKKSDLTIVNIVVVLYGAIAALIGIYILYTYFQTKIDLDDLTIYSIVGASAMTLSGVFAIASGYYISQSRNQGLATGFCLLSTLMVPVIMINAENNSGIMMLMIGLFITYLIRRSDSFID